jgi:rod shape-determining protein MreD
MQRIVTIAVTVAVALVLAIVDLPDWAENYRPQWVLMVLAYWAMALPHRVGVIVAWITGLAADVLSGALLGQQALGFAVSIYLVLTMHQRLRVFPLWQQAVAMVIIFLLERAVAFLVYGAVIGRTPPTTYWIPPLVSGLLWPWMFIFLRDVRRRFRVH